jgi:hypothetical protein
MNFSILAVFEILAIVGVIYLQYSFWTETRAKIRLFKDIIPDVKQFSLIETSFLENDLKTIPPIQLLERFQDYSSRAKINKADIDLELSGRITQILSDMERDGEEINHQTAYRIASEDIKNKYGSDWQKNMNKVNLTLLSVEGYRNEILHKIINSINTYLIRNKGAVADFNLLRDIIQRNLDAVEEEISMTIPIPVYLGLMGTMAGIILGLFALPDIGSEAFLQGSGINNLIGGVKIAMIASFTGLLFTVSNSGWLFKGAKSHVEREKNEFFTFLQTELLPVLTESVNAGIIGLNRTIERFGTSFNENVGKLDSLMNKNYDSLMAQQSAVEAFQKLDISRIANFNIKVLSEIKQSVDALERLGYALRNVDGFVVNSKALVERTSNVVDLSEKIVEILNETKQLQMFLNSHFNAIEQRGQIINDTVVRMDDVIDKSLKGLEQHIFERLQAVRDIKITAEDLLQKEFDQNRNVLGKLQFLEPLKNEFSSYSKAGMNSQNDMLNAINALQQKMTTNNQLLGKVLSQLQSSTITSQIKNIFGKKKNKLNDEL